ncbi:MAG: hypothetical protein R3E58_07480 [Phycisphaerae bacterium]
MAPDMVIPDVLIANIWMAVLLFCAGKQAAIDRFVGAIHPRLMTPNTEWRIPSQNKSNYIDVGLDDHSRPGVRRVVFDYRMGGWLLERS